MPTLSMLRSLGLGVIAFALLLLPGAFAPTPSYADCVVGVDVFTSQGQDRGPTITSLTFNGNQPYRIRQEEEIDAAFTLNGTDHATFAFDTSTYYATVTQRQSGKRWLHCSSPANHRPVTYVPLSIPSPASEHSNLFPFWDSAKQVVRLLTTDGKSASIGTVNVSGSYTVEFYFPDLFKGVDTRTLRMDFLPSLGQIYLWEFTAGYTVEATTVDVSTGSVTGDYMPRALQSNLNAFPPMALSHDGKCYSALTNQYGDSIIEMSTFCPPQEASKAVVNYTFPKPVLAKDALSNARLFGTGTYLFALDIGLEGVFSDTFTLFSPMSQTVSYKLSPQTMVTDLEGLTAAICSYA